ncbi:MAG: hypothetical protein ACJ788_02335 [Ktedonobacteraceae bacterium]
MTTNHLDQEARQRLAAEVIELGESLFEMALEAGTPQLAAGEESAEYPVEEIQAATAEFFIALRLLLGIAK